MINWWLNFLLRQKYKTCLLFLQFDKMVCQLLCFKVTDEWKATKRWFSNLFETSEITSTNLTIWNDHTCRWAQIWRICSWMQIYLILYKPKYNPKLELKALRETYKQQLPECISLPQRDKKVCDKSTTDKSMTKSLSKEIQHANIKQGLKTSLLKNVLWMSKASVKEQCN